MKHLIMVLLLCIAFVATFALAQDIVIPDTDSVVVKSVVETPVEIVESTEEVVDTSSAIADWRVAIEAILLVAVAIVSVWARKSIAREEKVKQTTKIIVSAGESLSECDKQKFRLLVKTIAIKAGIKDELDAIIDGLKEELKKEKTT